MIADDLAETRTDTRTTRNNWRAYRTHVVADCKLFTQTTLQVSMVHDVREERCVPLTQLCVNPLTWGVFGVFTFPRTTEGVKTLEEHK